VLEQELAGSSLQRLDAEIEYREPAEAGESRVVRDAHARWVTTPVGEVQASIVQLD
jgi:hypothetical protein